MNSEASSGLPAALLSSRLTDAINVFNAPTTRAFFEEAEAVRRSLEGDRSTEG